MSDKTIEQRLQELQQEVTELKSARSKSRVSYTLSATTRLEKNCYNAIIASLFLWAFFDYEYNRKRNNFRINSFKYFTDMYLLWKK